MTHPQTLLFSSPDAEVLKVSYCDRSMSVVCQTASKLCFTLHILHLWLGQLARNLLGSIGVTCRFFLFPMALRKQGYSNVLKILPAKIENFSDKNADIFHTSAQNIDCGYSLQPPRRGGSNEYPQFMFLSRNKKIMHTSVNPSFTT